MALTDILEHPAGIRCLASARLPIDPHEYRLLTDKVVINVGYIAQAVNMGDLKDVEVLIYDKVGALELLETRRPLEIEYPEEKAFSNRPPFAGVWRFFLCHPLLVVRDVDGREFLLDGGMRAKIGLMQDCSEFQVFRITLKDALSFGGTDLSSNLTDHLASLKGDSAVVPAGSSMRQKLGVLPVFMWSATEGRKPDDTIAILDAYFLTLFRIYFDQTAQLRGVIYGENAQEEMEKCYETLSYGGRRIPTRLAFPTAYYDRMAKASRLVYGLSPTQDLPTMPSVIFGGTESDLLRPLYVLGLVTKQAKEFSDFMFRYDREHNQKKGKRDPLLLDRLLLATEQSEHLAATTNRDGAAPVTIDDFFGIAAVTGVNVGRFYPNRSRMQGLLDWACYLHVSPGQEKVTTAPMRAHLAWRALIARHGGDDRCPEWDQFFNLLAPDFLMKLLGECFGELLAGVSVV